MQTDFSKSQRKKLPRHDRGYVRSLRFNRDRMDTEFPLVREAHDTPKESLRKRNDEILERIYIGRRFKNDTERLEKLFELYTKMTSQQASSKKSAKPKTKP